MYEVAKRHKKLIFNQLKFIFKMRKEGPEAKFLFVLPAIENKHQMTTRSKRTADFKV